MLYKKNSTPQLADELFRNPTSEYRGTPFWSWNTKPEKGMMERQMKAFQEMGFGGFHIHSRTGLDVPYLSDEFMDDVKFCVEYAKEHDMLAWAYDEDRFPSGFAGGLVTKDKKYRYRELFMTFDERTDYLSERPEGRAEESYLIAKFDIVLNQDGTLSSYKIIKDNEEAKGVIWYTYLRVASEESWFNNQTYVDTLNKSSIERFCEVTHERYKEVVGEYFGDVIPSFFTDEPKTTYKKTLPFAKDRRNLIVPWTDDFPDTFKEAYGFDMISHIPELVWELPDDQVSQARYLYHRHVAERFTEAYSQTISDWCENNGVHLTGHMIKEASLKSQSTAVGEAMQPLGPFGIPGIDMLCDEREYTTAKQAQSVAHQYGREAVVSELYGVTNWDFDFRGHITSGNWQTALGVTVRVPHLSWMSMEGEAKRDYPASIHYQSPWYKEYKLVEDYFSRIHTAMTRGKSIVKIAMIHPVESYWMHWADEEHTAEVRRQLDENFKNITEWLIYDHLDFDYISEALLDKIGSVKIKDSLYENRTEDSQSVADKAQGVLCVGQMEYDVILVPGCHTLRKSTLEHLQKLQEMGGNIVFAGNPPAYVEAKASEEVKELAGKCTCVSMEHAAITAALEDYRTVKIVDKNGNICNKMMYQLRRDGDSQWLFIVYGKKKARFDIEGTSTMFIKVPGEYEPYLYNAMTGEITPMPCSYENGETVVKHSYCITDGILIQLRSKMADMAESSEQMADVVECQSAVKSDEVVQEGSGNAGVQEKSVEERIPAVWANPLDPVEIQLSEPNVYMLDMAEYAVDDDTFYPTEEVLRIGVLMREKYGITPQSGRMAQPWTMKKEMPQHTLKLRYTIETDIDVMESQIALEHAEDVQIILNGQVVKKQITGYYTDEKIKTVCLPAMKKGVNILQLELPFGEGTDVENSFLLGDFGVEVLGAKQKITAPVRTLAFGDITRQGLPFYGGNVTYKIPLTTVNDVTVRAPYYKGSLIGVSIDGQRKGSIVLPPYKFSTVVEAGEHTLELTLFGNRINTFGCLHNCNENCTWFGPDAWRTKGDSYSYEYQLHRVGILKRPEIL